MTTTQTKNAETRMNTGFQHKQRRYETWTFQKKCSDLIPSFNMVRETGLEPVRQRHTHLKRACLPVPALALNEVYYNNCPDKCQLQFSLPSIFI